MAARHAKIAALLSPEARRALVDATEWTLYRMLPPDVPVPVYTELAAHALVTGQYLTARGEVVREYVLEEMLP